jgi:hypothetical protein
MTENLHERWAALIQAVRGAWRDRGRDPNLVEERESELKVRLPLDDGSTFHAETFSPDTLPRGDFQRAAARILARYDETARDEASGGDNA